ncbi:tRNA A64-2'-O-ribosylphosphate transferase [Vararia minispora EC-137]|uniref:tRNA A64-2'-O-ribosylphosphate transferase n=1 Tax=Vararia minispora EC-137 TaxID=1314806 RepID=A0ACB8QAQ8_9AGAM|nr:tRNA A64-2'-O-ribosylphosphate transferase [Vararia minispora EC-137]
MSLGFSSKSSLETEALAYLRRESLDIYNRLHSIEEDISFVLRVREAYPQLAITPNLRCGAWYINPELAAKGPAYFKSTDGHYNGWSFNLRRPNLHLLPLAVAGHGMILVDSTRSGKRLPDALSKTIPIWCAVINRAVVLRARMSKCGLNLEDWDVALYTPPGAVSSQERSQIELRLDQWALDLANSSYVLPELPHPLHPFWITPASSTYPSLSQNAAFIPIVCVSASKQVHDGIERRSLGFAYIQGSGDDHELWGLGLTPQLFWRHKATLLGAERSELEDRVRAVVADASNFRPAASDSKGSGLTSISKIYGKIKLCRLDDLPDLGQVSSVPANLSFILLYPPSSELAESSQRVLSLSIPSGKKGQYDFLHQTLPQVLEFATAQWRGDTERREIVVGCRDGKDTSIGAALALLQAWFDDEGALRPNGATKQSIRTRLQWIIASRPVANPSRATLQRVNDFILSRHFTPNRHVDGRKGTEDALQTSARTSTGT